MDADPFRRPATRPGANAPSGDPEGSGDSRADATGTPERPLKASKGGRPRLAHPRKLISLRLPPDVIERWKASGPGWQTRMAERLAADPVVTLQGAPGTLADPRARPVPSRAMDFARDALRRSEAGRTPVERAEAYLEHNELMAEQPEAGQHLVRDRAGSGS